MTRQKLTDVALPRNTKRSKTVPFHTGCTQAELTTGRVVIVEHEDAPVPDPPAIDELVISPAVDAVCSFHVWLASPEGRDCTDPRFLPVEPSRRQAELERRMFLAWKGALGD